MARIRTYQLDENITANDYLLGNDGDNGSVITKRFQLDDLREYILSGTDVDILRSVPRGYTVAVNQTGTDVERSPVEIVHTPVAAVEGDAYPAKVTSDGGIGGAEAFYAIDQNGQARIEINNYDGSFYLPGFVGTDVELTITGVTDPVYGTVRSYEGFAQNTADNENLADFVDTFYIELNDQLPLEKTLVESMAFTGGIIVTANLGNTVIGGDLQVDQTLTANRLVSEESAIFEKGLEVGGEDEPLGPGPANITVHGEVIFPDAGHGIVFGDGTEGELDDRLTITADGTGNVRTDGTGDVNFGNDITLLEGSNVCLNEGYVKVGGKTVDGESDIIIDAGKINRVDGDQNYEITNVSANENTEGSPENGGTLTHLQIGNIIYDVPLASSQSAFVLPGLHEDLSPVPQGANELTGQFFIADDRGAFAQFDRLVDITVPIVLAEGDNTANVLTTSIADDSTLTNALEAGNLDGLERLFFIDSANPASLDNTLLVDGETVTGLVYQVVNYVGINGAQPGVLTFSLIGEGNLVISTPTLTLDALRDTTTDPEAADPNSKTFLVIDDNNAVAKSTLEAVAGAQAQVTFDVNNDPNDDSVLTELDFKSSQREHAASVDANKPGYLGIDVSGRVPILGGVRTESFSAVDWGAYILGNIAEGLAASVTIPHGTVAGDVIRLYNLSSIDSKGEATKSEPWMVVPAVETTRIMGLPEGNSNIILDDSGGTVEFVWSGVEEIGWIIK